MAKNVVKRKILKSNHDVNKLINSSINFLICNIITQLRRQCKNARIILISTLEGNN